VLGVDSSLPLVHLILPLGLSFFTFEFLHYQIDLYRGGKPVRDPLHFALFPAFFPTQIAGPIKRYQDFEAQVLIQPRWDPGLFLEGVELVALGLFKKVVLADSLLPVADAVFSHTSTVTAVEGWTGLLAFSFQIYLDFSGYTDVARGSAQLLGYRVPNNFRAPYLATSIRDFWHRWHMSLSSWLRDYLYIPLGGSHRGPRRNFINLLLTMGLGGLWHGAAWHFVAWGAGHGAALAAHRAYSGRARRIPSTGWAGLLGGWALTQGAVLGLWTLFRAPGLAAAMGLWRGLLAGGVSHPLLTWAVVLQVLGICILVLATEFVTVRVDVHDWLRTRSMGVVLRPAFVVSLAVASTFVAAVQVTHRFIYFQF
jgi:alginate O-acetyltransferase complex protein AlgI